ncbi:methylaspartate mutase subunit E [Paenibacillus sp. JCM 10914]|uniref:methylaspartate mutase subunit E n=1 Tax=Paenibacillus sp. JCM 10914 TaxID=1236974 RepID=UPI0003CC67FE|nr:methylaspartate mutase subunit E [Paenibacillus sp. JCM 10914]GAE10024.1 methylaspartate mutase, E subunit [Paenibacillus sp. JCM 10914]
MKLMHRKWTEDQFYKVRKEVLNQWHTGKGIDIEHAASYLQSVPKHKSFHRKMIEADREGKILLQPRAGVGGLQEHIKLLHNLEKSGADILPTTIDSFTRQNQYEHCEEAIRETSRLGRSMLNGFPAVNYGVEKCKLVFESVNLPLQARHGTPDARLLSEIVHASGWTSNEGGGISYNIPYAKKVSLERSLLDWQYCDKLVGIYEELGIRLNREPFGPLTGTLVPPCVSNAVAILEGLMAAEQGVKSITLGYGQLGNLCQDVAAIRVLKELAQEYFDRFEYEGIELTTVLHQWMGAFPNDETQALALISWGSVTAKYAGVTKIIVKTPQEALGVPTAESNAQGIRMSRAMLNWVGNQNVLSTKELTFEIDMLRIETRCIIDRVIELGWETLRSELSKRLNKACWTFHLRRVCSTKGRCFLQGICLEQ